MNNYLNKLEFNDDIFRKATISIGNLFLLQKSFKKAKSGESITVAFLGGSITQGCLSSSDEKCYAYLTYQWFKEQFPQSDIRYVNAGIGATGSLIGVHRVERDVLSFSPDVVFVEYSVNDSACEYDKIAYESLIRTLLCVKNQPAVIELFTGCETGSNVQDQHIAIGENYQLPMISYRDLIEAEIKTGNISWKEISPDDTHPNDLGHSIVAALTRNFLSRSLTADNAHPLSDTLPKPIFGSGYTGGTILNSSTLSPTKLGSFTPFNDGFQKFPNAWQSIKEQDSNEPMEITVKGRNIFLLYKKSISTNFGKVIISAKGLDDCEVDGLFHDGWGDCSETRMLVSSKEEKAYTFHIQKKESGKDFVVLGFLVSNS